MLAAVGVAARAFAVDGGDDADVMENGIHVILLSDFLCI